ncbi:Trk system potassium transporter TrkA [Halorhabdus rudnickae]|uniref:Trk system potassium transporter TrkA n=1 Tax=Halorhabdus rudnickae TaxID=1775544 RepID=UPI001083D46E|nr:Trk system potassium transporter TrkA [Halorhabdus rudnickae]
MRVIIAGAGQVGRRVAAKLDGAHDVVVIDTDADRIDSLGYELDVLTALGDSSTIETLEEAGIADADLLIASTDSDEINILTCETAKALSDVTTVARVRQLKYIETWDRADDVFGVDFMVGTNLLTIGAAVGGTGLEAANSFDVFAGGTVHVAEFEVDPGGSLVGLTVEEADTFEGLTFGALVRSGTTIVPTGSTQIEAGDGIIVMGKPESVHTLGTQLSQEKPATQNVLIVGGSDIGYHTARLLEERGLRPHLLERDPDRARELSERLSATTVRNTDPTTRDFLETERAADIDVVVAALDQDSEANLLAALRAKRMGVDRSVAIVDHGDYVDLFETAGVDVAVNPRRATAEEIIEFARDQDTQNVALLEDNHAEVIEIRIDTESALAGRPIAEAIADFPPGVVIGAITRHGSFLRPRGDTVVKPGDHVVVLADSDGIEDVMQRL